MNKLVIGKTIMIPAMRRGLCKYADETVLLSQATLEKLAKTSHGIPVIIDHQQVDSANVEQVVVGRVADMHYDTDTDNWNVHFVVDTQEAVDLLNSGWGVSTSYEILQSGPGGTLNNVPYDREVADGRYLHLAIVRSPRYEMARNPVFFNSREGGKGMFKLWRTRREEVKMNEEEELVIEIEGKPMSLATVLEEMTNMEAPVPKQVMMQADDVVEYNGSQMKVSELVEKYNKMKNETIPVEEEKKEQEVDEEEKKVDEEEKKVDEEEKKEEKDNSSDDPEVKDQEKRFNEIKTAPIAEPVEADCLSLRERTVAGRSRYGSGQ